MNSEFLAKINKVMSAAKALEDALSEYGGIVDVCVKSEADLGSGSSFLCGLQVPLNYSVMVNLRADYSEGSVVFLGRGPVKNDE